MFIVKALAYPKTPKVALVPCVGGTRSRVFSTCWIFGVFVSGFGASILSFIYNTGYSPLNLSLTHHNKQPLGVALLN